MPGGPSGFYALSGWASLRYISWHGGSVGVSSAKQIPPFDASLMIGISVTNDNFTLCIEFLLFNILDNPRRQNFIKQQLQK